jgi:hypothetical protein
VGDGGVGAADFVLGCVGHRERQRAAEGVDDLVVGGPGRCAVRSVGLVVCASMWDKPLDNLRINR